MLLMESMLCCLGLQVVLDPMYFKPRANSDSDDEDDDDGCVVPPGLDLVSPQHNLTYQHRARVSKCSASPLLSSPLPLEGAILLPVLPAT